MNARFCQTMDYWKLSSTNARFGSSEVGHFWSQHSGRKSRLCRRRQERSGMECALEYLLEVQSELGLKQVER